MDLEARKLKYRFFLLLPLLLLSIVFLSIQSLKADEPPIPPPQIPLPDSCFDHPGIVPWLHISHQEDTPILPFNVATSTFTGITQPFPPEPIFVEYIPHFNEESYDANLKFNLAEYYCQTEVLGSLVFDPDRLACLNEDWGNITFAGFINFDFFPLSFIGFEGYVEWLWGKYSNSNNPEDLIEPSINPDPDIDYQYESVSEFIDIYIDLDHFVGNYGVGNADYVLSAPPYTWGFFQSNNHLLQGPNPNNHNHIQCKNEIDGCLGPYFEPDKVDEDGNPIYTDGPNCPKVPPMPNPGHPDYQDWVDEYGDWMDLDPYSNFGSGTIVPPSGPGSQWSQSLGHPIGGQVLSVSPCLCSGNWEVFIDSTQGGINPGWYTYAWLGQFAHWRLPWPRHWVLGLYSNQQSCVILVPGTPPTCVLKPNQGTISPVVGTSPF